jgi:type VI secretion system protein ImpK
MNAETYSVSLVSRFSVPENRIPQGYYRSKLFIAASTTNPLVAAAGPLFSLLERLCVSPTLPPVGSIRDNIDHELQAFNSRLAGQTYSKELVVIASYLLCATIDELLGKNYVRLYGKPAEFKAFTPSSHDKIGPERRFFEIITYLKEQPNQFLDLLELAYYCLIAGFEGELHLRADGRQTLENLIEELYQLIQQYRVNKPHRLFKDQPNALPEPINRKPIIAGVLIVVGLMTSIFFASHTLLEHKARNLLIGHPALVKMER